ncbi:MAG: hypothetical protein R3E32_25550 [Chitinophagales bacterium]
MKGIITTIILLTVNCLLNAQSNSLLSLATVANMKLSSPTTVILNDPIAVGFSDDLENINGGPFYDNKWLKGRILLKDGQELGSEWLFKYNTFQDELHVLLVSGEVKIPLKSHIQAFMIEQDGQQHYFVSSDFAGVTGKQTTNTFFEVLHHDRFTLLKKSSKHHGQLNNNSFYCSSCGDASFDFFYTAETYYVKDNQGEFKELKIKRRDILKAFPKHKSLIVSYLKKNKSKVKTETDLLTLLQYIESPKDGSNEDITE